MQRWLQNISDPSELVLAWQADDAAGERYRWAVGIISAVGDAMELRYLSEPDFERFNPSRSYGQLADLGYRGYPGFRPKDGVHTVGVAEAFMRRLPPRARSDFAAYQAHFRIPSTTRISDLALLGATEAKLPGDGFSLVDCLSTDCGPLDLMNEVAGYRYYMGGLASAAVVGDEVDIVPEDGNQHDPLAVQCLIRDVKIGNVNRLQAPSFRQRMGDSGGLRGTVERINGKPERPRVFVFVTLPAIRL